MGIPKDVTFKPIIQPNLSNENSIELDYQGLSIGTDVVMDDDNYYSGAITLGEASTFVIKTRDTKVKASATDSDAGFFAVPESLDSTNFFETRKTYSGQAISKSWDDIYSYFWYTPLLGEIILGEPEEVDLAANFFDTPSAVTPTPFFSGILNSEGTPKTQIVVDGAASVAAGQEQSAYSETLVATGGSGNYTAAITSGILPAGLTLSGMVISGTPTENGLFSFTLSVTDDEDNLAGTKSFSLFIAELDDLAISTSSLPNGELTELYGQALAGTGGTFSLYSWAVSGLPSGLSVNALTGIISGTPTQFGTFPLTITLTSGTLTEQVELNLTILQDSSITPLDLDDSALPNVDEGVAYNQTRTVSGGSAPYALSLVGGSLPSGITATLASTTVTIAGTCNTPNVYSFTLRITDNEGVFIDVAYSMVVVLVNEPLIPPLDPTTVTLAGVGWNGSDTLVNFPQTGAITGGASSIVVELDTHATKTPAQVLLTEALPLLSTYDKLILRNDSDELVNLTERITRSTSWGSEKLITAYDDQRIRMKYLNGSKLINFSGKNERWKGFELSGTRDPDGALLFVSNGYGRNLTMEDVIFTDYNSYGALIWQAGGVDFIDCIWHSGNTTAPLITGTNAGDCVGINGMNGIWSQDVRIVRCYLKMENSDDIVDMFYGRDCEIRDSVLKAVRPNPVSGDGNGAKMGGTGRGDAGNNLIQGCLIIDVAADGITDNGTKLPLTANQNTIYNTGGRAIDFNNIEDAGAEVTNNVIEDSDSYLVGGATVVANNSWGVGGGYAPIDAANDDYSYASGSNLVGKGTGGQNIGASEVALKLEKKYGSIF